MKNAVTYLLWIVSVLFICFFWSCGARKVNKQESKEETKTELTDNSVTEKQTETNIKTETKLTVDDKNESVTTETTYSPEDPTKEAYVIEKDGTKVVLNNSKKIVKTETKKNNLQTTSLENKIEVKKEAEKEQKAVANKEVSKKENSSKEVKKEQYKPFNLICIGLLILVLLWCAYRIYKKLPLVPKF